jgi:hypothetical protein
MMGPAEQGRGGELPGWSFAVVCIQPICPNHEEDQEDKAEVAKMEVEENMPQA